MTSTYFKYIICICIFFVFPGCAVFEYKEGSDSVLVVTRDEYNACNTTNPITSLTNGGSIFTLDRSGPFYFISGKDQNCQKGQKLVVVVLAVRNKKRHPTSPPSASPSPASSAAPLPSSTGPTLSPEAQSPEAESPGSRVDPSDLNAPAPAPNENSGNGAGFSGSFGLVLCAGLGVSMVLGI